MANRADLTTELRAVSCASFPDLFQRFQTLSREYSPAQITNALRMVNGFGSLYTPNPFIQNQRVKGISTRPAGKTKSEVAQMVENPEQNEKPLRQVERALEYTAYPIYHIRQTYQNLLTYHSYIAPAFADAESARKDDFWREWMLLEKLRCELDIGAKMHEIAGQAQQEGKVFYTVRSEVDKAHNTVRYAFLQQLPSDYCKIVGMNNRTKYTVAFDLMYFAKMGTDYRMYGDLFAPYMDLFAGSVTPEPRRLGDGLVFAQNTRPMLRKSTALQCKWQDVEASSPTAPVAAERLSRDAGIIAPYGAPEVVFQNGRWCYWVTLPAEKVFTFEVDNTNRNVVSPLTGLFLDMIQLSQMEQIQLELLQNPLVSILTGEIPYFDNKEQNIEDKYKLSETGRKFFEAIWGDMLAANNTGGVGLYMAPLQNMHLQSLTEAPNAMDIVTKGYQDTISKAGLSGILPSSSDTRAGAVQVSFQIESQFLKEIYRCAERMMRVLIDGLRLKYNWRFVMFGSLYEDDKTEERCMKGMEHGMLGDLMVYNALHGRSIFDDIGISDAVLACDVMNKRRPLITSFSAKQADGLPPQSEGGRPKEENVTTDGNEGDVDSL